MTKVLKFSNFQRFFALFSKFLTELMDCNVKTGQKGKNVLSIRLLRRVYCSFSVKKSQIDTENDKNLKIFQF